MSAMAPAGVSHTIRRSAARLAAVQALYQCESSTQSAREIIDEFIAHRLGREIEGATYAEADTAFFADLVGGVSSRRDEIDALVAGSLTAEWSPERLDRTLRAVLRAGAYELLVRIDVPARVVINEYVDVAHAFFAGPEPGLVNGVLDDLGRKLRPTELRGNDGGQTSDPG